MSDLLGNDRSTNNIVLKFISPQSYAVETYVVNAKDFGVPRAVVDGFAWQIRNRPAAGQTASATQSAPGANKQLVITSISFTALSTLISINLSSYVEVIDGAGVVLWDGVFGVKGTALGDFSSINLPVVLVASINQSVTIRFGAGATNLAQAVAANGYIVDVS